MLTFRVEKLVPGGTAWAAPKGGGPGEGGPPRGAGAGEPKRKKGALFLEAPEILEAHPGRYPEPLPPSADLPLAYETQLPLKEALVRDALERVAKLEAPLAPIRPSPRPLAYRTAAQYARHPLGGLAYRLPESHELHRLEKDPLLAEPLAWAFDVLKLWPLPVEEVALRGSLRGQGPPRPRRRGPRGPEAPRQGPGAGGLRRGGLGRALPQGPLPGPGYAPRRGAHPS